MSEEEMVNDVKSKQIGRRTFIKMAGLAGGGLFLISCAPSATPASKPAEAPKASSGASAPAPAAKPKISATIDFAFSAGGVALNALPMFVAEDAGFLAEEGITEKKSGFNPGAAMVQGMLQAKVPMGNPAALAIAQAFAEDQVLKVVADNCPLMTAAWIVRADSPIKSMKDIKGKKFGYTGPGGESHIFALAALKALGFKEGEDVQLVVVRGIPDQYTALKNGIIDIAWSVDPIITQGIIAKEVRILTNPEEFVSDWSQSMIAVNPDWAKDNGDVLTAYLRAYVKAMDFIKNNTDKAGEIWGTRTNVPVDVAKLAMKNYPVQKFSAQFNPKIFKSLTEVMVANKLVKEAPPWNKIVDQSYLPASMRVQIS